MPDLSGTNHVGLAIVWVPLAFSSCRCDDGTDDAPRGSGCQDEGTVYVAAGAAEGDPRVRLRATHGGCKPCPGELRPGAPARAPCQAPSVCADVCCECPKARRFFTASACLEGVCAGQKEACRAVLERFGDRLCSEP